MRRYLPFLLLTSLAIPGFAKGKTSQNPYPNELSRFKFYAKYLDPLRPYVSERTLVAHVLGSSTAVESENWRIVPYFVDAGNTSNGHPWASDITGRLASVGIFPKKRVSMLGIKFPGAFTHSFGSVSEINVSCDVYKDSFGLEYWLYSDDTNVGKKGDLMRIDYGPSEQIKRDIIGPS